MSEPRNEKGQTLSEFLADYDISVFPRPSVTADNIILTHVGGKRAILLIKRRNHPFIGCWAFPGGFMEPDEELSDGAKRELMEETGVTGITPVQLGAYGRPHRDPRGWIITVAFISELPDDAKIKAADDAKDAALFTIDVEKNSVTLTHSVTNEKLVLPVSIKDGHAEFIPVEGFAGDHPQILIDALIKLGMIKK